MARNSCQEGRDCKPKDDGPIDSGVLQRGGAGAPCRRTRPGEVPVRHPKNVSPKYLGQLKHLRGKIPCHPERSKCIAKAEAFTQSKDPYPVNCTTGPARNSHTTPNRFSRARCAEASEESGARARLANSRDVSEGRLGERSCPWWKCLAGAMLE